VSAIALLMGLLVLSFLGSLITGGKTARGLPSGVEYLGLGFAVGPHMLGLVERDMIVEFEPVVRVALGWLAFVVGLDFGRIEGRRVRSGSMALGIAGAALTGVLVAAATYQVLQVIRVPGIDHSSAKLFAGCAGAVTAETTRFAVQWVTRRWDAKGPVSMLLREIGSSDDFAPLVAVGAIFSFTPIAGTAMILPAWGWFAASLLLGALLGTVTALLLRGAEGDAVWGALVGTILLGVGVTARFGLSIIFVTFVMGIALAAVSPTRRALRRMVGATERAVLYPMLLLAGAHLNPFPVIENHALGAVVALILLARIVGKLVSGVVVGYTVPAARPAGAGLGIVLLSSGPITISVGFAFALRYPGIVGDTLLVIAVASNVLGEIVSTFALKRLFEQVGEISAPAEGRASTRDLAQGNS
jgi:hypothetical protein